MAGNEQGGREPIDADFEPARHGQQGIGMGTACALAVVSALGGGAIGALAPRTPALAPLLDAAAPDALTQTRLMQATAAQQLADAKLSLDAINAAGGVSPQFKADYLQVKANLDAVQKKVANIDVGLKLFPDGPPETSALRARLAAIEALPRDPALTTDQQLARAAASLQVRVAELEKKAGGIAMFEAAAGASPAQLMARIVAIETQQKALSIKLDAAATSAQLVGVSDNLKVLQGQFSDVAQGAKAATDAARAAYAVSAATDASRSSGPFEPAYAALLGVLPEDQNVLALAPLARRGAPTREELNEQFGKIEIELVRAARVGDPGPGMWGQMQASLAQFIVIRKVDAPDESNDLVESASARVRANDLEGAVARLSQLKGESAKVVAPWLEKAKARVEIDARLAAIRTQLSKKG